MFAALSLKVLEKTFVFATVEWIASAFSAINLSARSSTPPARADRVCTLSTMLRTLSGSIAFTTLSASSERVCKRAASGWIVLPSSPTPLSAASTPSVLLASACEKVWAFSSVV